VARQGGHIEAVDLIKNYSYRACPILFIPYEVLLHVMVLLEPHDLCSVAQVCSVLLSYSLPASTSRHTNASCGGDVQTLNEASSDDHLWRRFCSPHSTSQGATNAWKARYMSWLQPRLRQYSSFKSTI
jgi:hypothetical protein